MIKNISSDDKIYKTIGEAAKELGLIDKKTGSLQTHTIRYWESQFKQLRPLIKAGGRRYYSNKDIKIIAHIKFLLKEKGLTINGVKKLLNSDKSHSIDDITDFSVYKSDPKSKKNINDRIKNIYKIIKELKKFKNG